MQVTSFSYQIIPNTSGNYLICEEGRVFSKHSNKVLKGKKDSKEVHQYTLLGVFVASFPTITEAAKSINRGVSAITNNLAGRTKSCAGYKWSKEKIS